MNSLWIVHFKFDWFCFALYKWKTVYHIRYVWSNDTVIRNIDFKMYIIRKQKIGLVVDESPQFAQQMLFGD